MIEFVSGNIFNCDAEALVNPVNTAGVMGKGLAKQFRERFPEIMEPYREACDSGEFKTGMVFTVQVAENQSPKYIINFPTKRHWRSKSKLEYIESG
ncbi:MAG: macro domain-containing protein, partial [Planctomycetaceae bacterium]|nr:macro domain-containing protein [Planctomycetaceae bacterium]